MRKTHESEQKRQIHYFVIVKIHQCEGEREFCFGKEKIVYLIIFTLALCVLPFTP